MRKLNVLIFIVTLSLNVALAQVADYVVLSEIYGGGGEQGSHWSNDYITLYNPTSDAVDLSTWSVQYAIFNSSTWRVTNLIGTIPAGGYYAIQMGGGVQGIAPLPFTPNVIGNINIDKNKGKIALVNIQSALTVSNPIGNPNVIDFVGYGNGTNAFEGSEPAPQSSTTESVRRKDNNGNNTYGINGNGWDSNDNFLDFYLENNLVVNPPLPVELSFFSAIILENGVKLKWRTETEISNYGFEILRSTQNDEWDVLGFVQGYGNSNSPKNYSFVDENVSSGKYSYRLKQIDTDGQFEYSKVIEVVAGKIPNEIVLEQNYPNPFNPTTTIKFAVAETQKAELKVFDVLGNEVVSLFNGVAEEGIIYELELNGENLSSGIYFYRLETNSKVENRKMLLLK